MVLPSSFNKPSASIGFYGKLPAHGDFVSRGLSPTQVTAVDNWLQAAVVSAQENLGANWLDKYLQTPAWRFVLSPGIIDGFSWAGILLPSVDRVGRYFPLMALVHLPAATCLSEFLSMQQTWFAGLEDCLRAALNGRVQIDSIIDTIDALETTERPLFMKLQHPGSAEQHSSASDSQSYAGHSAYGEDTYKFSQTLSPRGDMHHAMAVLALLDQTLSAAGTGYSLWSTLGSDTRPPSVNACRGLPKGKESMALITGEWQNCGWKTGFSYR